MRCCPISPRCPRSPTGSTPALPMAGVSRRRQRALVRLRPVLRLAGREPDGADVLRVGAVRGVEPRSARAAGPSCRIASSGSACRSCWRPRLLMPVAYYPAYAASPRSIRASPRTGSTGLALPFWPCGPQWFLWLLLAFNIVAVMFHRLAPQGMRAASGAPRGHDGRPSGPVLRWRWPGCRRWPMCRSRSRFTPWTWADYGPLSFQISRPLHYFVYFSRALRSAPTASIADCSPPTACWRGTGRPGLARRSPASSCGRCRPR